MSVKLLTKQHLEFVSLKGSCTGSSESTHVKMPHCWKSHVTARIISARTQKQKRQEQPRVPRSLFDRPTAQLLKLRRDAKFQKLKQGQLKLYRPMPSMPQKPIMEQAPDHPEWLIHEDWALLQVNHTLVWGLSVLWLHTHRAI